MFACTLHNTDTYTCNLVEAERKVNLFRVAADVGRLTTNFFMLWCFYCQSVEKLDSNIVYSPIILKDVLPVDHLRYWLLFVRSCCILCSRCIKRSDVESADFIEHFSRQFQEQCRDLSCSANMHLYLGDIFGFWSSCIVVFRI